MNVEELKKGLNKSLIIECVSMIVVPIILDSSRNCWKCKD